MKETQEAKVNLRKKIASVKKNYSEQELLDRSDEVFSVVEITGVFQDAKRLLIYNSLSDEVHTHDFIERWKDEKEIYLPAIVNDKITFRRYTSSAELIQSALGIGESQGEEIAQYKADDLIIVPGMAFDRRMNRLGRGKGYYDRFLKEVKGTKLGVCFDFQLLDAIPFDANDVKMDMLVSENDLIW